MALSSCPDCAGAVSTDAVTCPHCGRPTGRGQVIEQTSKRLKGQMVAFGLFALFGVGVWLLMVAPRHDRLSDLELAQVTYVCGAVVVVGLVGFVVSLVRRWWHHG